MTALLCYIASKEAIANILVETNVTFRQIATREALHFPKWQMNENIKKRINYSR